NGDSNHKTPDEFQKRARQDIENHLKKFKSIQSDSVIDNNIIQSNNDLLEIDSNGSNNLLQSNSNNNNIINNNINNNNNNNNNSTNKHSVSPLLRSLKRVKT
ncbi:TATA element modulatory factor 1, partial [Pichia californica]